MLPTWLLPGNGGSVSNERFVRHEIDKRYDAQRLRAEKSSRDRGSSEKFTDTILLFGSVE
jgi:hypothetical protein